MSQTAIHVDRETKEWLLKKEDCVHCGLCAKVCPKHCIEMKEE
ncbi:MAG: 4Fe-4S dicluster domain-containing protein [Erysipelotrichaceae bacterium]|nr:4Fe-4S dicluster domain-containing protein [Erysipelotrichaceae bacterium]